MQLKMKSSLVIIGLLVFMACQPKHDVPVTINLHSNWSFKTVTDSIWHAATVPGSVHSDLIDNNLIEHPFIGDNEELLQWISETDWEYKTQFNLSEETLLKKHIVLNFEGLDTYATVFLNDSLILNTNNAFSTFKVDVKKALKEENNIRILFENTQKYETQEKAKLPYLLPEGDRVFTRKAQFQYGWDWAPKLNTFGIWKPITLTAWNNFKIQDVYINQVELNDTLSKCIVDLKTDSNINEDLKFEIYVNDTLNTTYSNKDKSEITFQIKNPKRWWPHNLGTPYLYTIKVIVKDKKRILDSVSVKKGLRTIELVTEKDTIGESFYFKVNNQPVYMKGANYIPQNSMQNLVTTQHYKKLLNDVVSANMNMLRVWGGGIYENDMFYDLCDEKGILVWQDFMFACAMYPGDTAFLKTVKNEAEQNVKRLRNHASIALWCGNNENAEGWKRWGWQANRSEQEKEEIWNNYLKVFDSILPNTVRQFTSTNYWQTSPKYGRGNTLYKTEGDAHDWWIWHDAYPFEHLEKNVPRFMSEFGFQSLPSYEIINYINQSDSLHITSEEFINHQKHSRGSELIDTYMKRDFPVPTQPEDYIYMSQALQAYGITKGIEAHRRAKPYNMGTLYWQLNDCWPSVSWSSIDFFGNWKALHYKAKKAFKNELISSVVENDTLKTYVINDSKGSFYGMLSIKILDLDGQMIFKDTKTIDIDANSSDIKYELDLKTIQLDKRNAVVITKLGENTSYFYLAKPKDLKLKKLEIIKKVLKTDLGYSIELSCKTLQKEVFLFTKTEGHFTDNFFDLMPNETKTIEFQTEASILNEIKLKTLNMFID